MNYQKVEVYLLYVLGLMNLLALVAIGIILSPYVVQSDPPDLLQKALLQNGIIEIVWIVDMVIFLIALSVRIFKR